MSELNLPPPGVDGTWRDSCVVCFRGTDTALGFEGPGEWIIAGLSILGVPVDQAGALVSMSTGCELGEVPPGRIRLVFRVCQACVDKSGTGFPVALATDRIPHICEPSGEERP